MFRLKSLLIFCLLVLSILPFFIKFGEIKSASQPDKYCKLLVNGIDVNDDAIYAPSSYFYLEMISFALPATLLLTFIAYMNRNLQLRFCFAAILLSAIQLGLMIYFLFSLENIMALPQMMPGLGLTFPLSGIALGWFTCNQIANEHRTDEFNYFRR